MYNCVSCANPVSVCQTSFYNYPYIYSTSYYSFYELTKRTSTVKFFYQYGIHQSNCILIIQIICGFVYLYELHFNKTSQMAYMWCYARRHLVGCLVKTTSLFMNYKLRLEVRLPEKCSSKVRT